MEIYGPGLKSTLREGPSRSGVKFKMKGAPRITGKTPILRSKRPRPQRPRFYVAVMHGT